MLEAPVPMSYFGADELEHIIRQLPELATFDEALELADWWFWRVRLGRLRVVEVA